MDKERKFKKDICTAIAEATGTPIDFQEGVCGYVGCKSCIYSGLAKALINAGYGKADNVRKETAKEILTDIANIINQTWGELDGDDLRMLAEKYDVEVE